MIKAYVLIAARAGKEKQVYDELGEIRQIKTINELYGEWDLIAVLEAQDLGELDSIISESIRGRADIKLTSTMIVAR